MHSDELNYQLIDDSKIFHFGSLSMTDSPAREVTFEVIRYAKDSGKLIFYDPNWRSLLWPDVDTARRWMLEGLKYASVAKRSEVKLALLTGQDDLEAGINALSDMKIGFYRCDARIDGVLLP